MVTLLALPGQSRRSLSTVLDERIYAIIRRMDQLTQFLEQVVFTISGEPLTIADLLLVPAILLTGWLAAGLLSRGLTRMLERRHTSADVVHLVRRIYWIIAIAVLAVTALELVGVPLTAFAFVSGAVAIGVGFGAQNIINNFISGWILMWERPIRIGDFLEVGDATGTVETINTRSTRIRRVDGVHMLIPNSTLLENTVVNWTLIDDRMRTNVRVGVAYGSSVREVQRLVMQAVTEADFALETPAPMVVFEDFGDNALIFDAFFWVHAGRERTLREMRSDVRFRIAELFDEAGIVVAFPQRDVHVDGRLVVEHDAAS